MLAFNIGVEAMIEEKLNKIIENHKHWLNQDCEGWEDMKANLNSINLQGVDLRGLTYILLI